MRRLQGRALPRLAQEELKRGWTMAPCSAAAAAAAVAAAAVAAAASAAVEVPDGNYFVQSPSHLTPCPAAAAIFAPPRQS